MDRLRTAQALGLQNTMQQAHETMDKAYKNYMHAFGRAMDRGAIGILALRREGEFYAQALHRYTGASMAWLAYVDTNVRPPFKMKGAGS